MTLGPTPPGRWSDKELYGSTRTDTYYYALKKFPFDPPADAGSTKSKPISPPSPSGAVVKKFDVWAKYNGDQGNYIGGFLIDYTDGTQSKQVGSMYEDRYSITFEPGELVTSFAIWVPTSPNWNNQIIVGRLRITTNKNQTLDTGTNNKNTGQIHYVPVGSGLFCGVWGFRGDAIDNVGALFPAQSVVSCGIDITGYTNDPTGEKVQGAPVELSCTTYTGPGTPTFNGTQKRTNSSEHTSASMKQYQLSESLQISGKFFGLGPQSTTTASWTSQRISSLSRTSTEEVDLSWTMTTDALASNKRWKCCALVWAGSLSLPYDSTVTLTFSDGWTSTYEEKGVYNNVTYGQVFVTSEYPDAITNPPTTAIASFKNVEKAAPKVSVTPKALVAPFEAQ